MREDGTYHWTGIIGQLMEEGDADLSSGGLTLTVERAVGLKKLVLNLFHFLFPIIRMQLTSAWVSSLTRRP